MNEEGTNASRVPLRIEQPVLATSSIVSSIKGTPSTHQPPQPTSYLPSELVQGTVESVGNIRSCCVEILQYAVGSYHRAEIGPNKESPRSLNAVRLAGFPAATQPERAVRGEAAGNKTIHRGRHDHDGQWSRQPNSAADVSGAGRDCISADNVCSPEYCIGAGVSLANLVCTYEELDQPDAAIGVVGRGNQRVLFARDKRGVIRGKGQRHRRRHVKAPHDNYVVTAAESRKQEVSRHRVDGRPLSARQARYEYGPSSGARCAVGG